MTTTLNNYTIDDFIKIKPVIYEYCVNLTQKKTTTSWFRDFADADDLYQEVFLYVYDNFFNKTLYPLSEGKFIQIMKNHTYWTYQRRFSRKGAKLYQRLNRIDDSPKDLFLFEETHWENGKSYVEFTESIDYKYYTKSLKPIEQKAIGLYLEGYLIKEINEKCNKRAGWFDYVIHRKLSNIVKKDVPKIPKPISTKIKAVRTRTLKENDVEFVKSKVSSFDNVFNFRKSNDKFIKLYSLYLQGVGITEIAKTFKSSNHQISVELFRIKQKIKKYAE